MAQTLEIEVHRMGSMPVVIGNVRTDAVIDTRILFQNIDLSRVVGIKFTVKEGR